MLVQHIYSLCAGKWPCLFVWHWSGSFHYVRMRVSHPFLLARKEWEWRIYKETELCCSTASATRPAANIYISDMSSSTPKRSSLAFTPRILSFLFFFRLILKYLRLSLQTSFYYFVLLQLANSSPVFLIFIGCCYIFLLKLALLSRYNLPIDWISILIPSDVYIF